MRARHLHIFKYAVSGHVMLENPVAFTPQFKGFIYDTVIRIHCNLTLKCQYIQKPKLACAKKKNQIYGTGRMRSCLHSSLYKSLAIWRCEQENQPNIWPSTRPHSAIHGQCKAAHEYCQSIFAGGEDVSGEVTEACVWPYTLHVFSDSTVL